VGADGGGKAVKNGRLARGGKKEEVEGVERASESIWTARGERPEVFRVDGGENGKKGWNEREVKRSKEKRRVCHKEGKETSLRSNLCEERDQEGVE